MSELYQLERLQSLSYWHVRGAMQLPEAIALAWFEQISLDQSNAHESGFIARTGTTEFLVMDDPSSELVQHLQTQAEQQQLQLFPRDDAVFRLSHPQWQTLLLQVCSYNFSAAKPGQFVTVSMAGVGCWFVIKDVSASEITFGCDPSYAVYIEETIADVLQSTQDHANA